MVHAALGLRLEPFGHAAHGPWLAAHGGAAQTGGLTRGMLSAATGWDFALSGGRLGVGPTLGWLHVFQPDSELRPADANILTLGVHGVWQSREEKAGPRDTDGDGILDPVDRCPRVPEDKDGFEDEDGCPDEDNDHDGLADASDRCPNEAEDKDEFEDTDGCPDLDNDQDGVPDANDKCPTQPETRNGFEDEDGCPDTAPLVFMTKEKIVITQKINFAKGTDQILAKSNPILEAVAKILKENDGVLKVSVEGHTSSEGDPKFNRKLSEKRARAIVNNLVKRGIDKGRLEFKGWGSDKPLAPLPEADEAAREENRRVEFLILEQK
jgi:outer membrane protein OmpA-like peptidoglycan-associated protein